ncbi:hydroxyacid dehydrogenase [Kamptonema sp. UHCC 0994]|uniref:hydroxyacid dehydrogenase n=1 Tax=Kamptonema sp. UHCC 0994 TaxID=3031329 RepID=UPI0023B91070|nr:hydroxyacid dehydrogenase [Kamptonema sp. UHCC 0994]MDF0555602.1 hydroxyacid dehydrogenase [Kamptonema sp. UHCC 0994]
MQNQIMPRKVLVISEIHPAGIAELKKCAVVDKRIGLSSEELLELIPQYDGVVLRSGIDHLKKDARILEAGRRGQLRVVGLAQTGTDNVNIETAEQLGIEVFNSNTNDVSTAEFVFGVMFGLARNIIAAQQALLNGHWEKRHGPLLGIELKGKTLGIIGLGNIGQKVAERAQVFGMEIIAYNRNRERVEALARERGYTLLSLEELLEKSDIITLHISLEEETNNLINAAAIDRMKETAFIINCARGGIVNEADLLKALESDQIAGAALDVFVNEPLPEDSPLREFAGRSNKLCLSPHLGSGTHEAQRKVAIDVAGKICEYLCSL